MIATVELTETACRAAVNQYLANVLGTAYRAGRAKLCISGQIHKLADDQLRNMCEAGSVQAAQARRELARDDDGYVLRRHAWIKASSWLSTYVGMKIGAEDGQFLDQASPIWRFSIVCYLRDLEAHSFGTVDVDAITGQVTPLPDKQIQTIQEAVSAAVRYQKQTSGLYQRSGASGSATGS